MKRMTIFEYFESHGYNNEEIKDIINGLKEKDIELIKVRNGQDLDNPVYNTKVTQNQRNAYMRLIKKIQEKLVEKYGIRENSIIKPEAKTKTASLPKENHEKVIKKEEIANKFNINQQSSEETSDRNIIDDSKSKKILTDNLETSSLHSEESSDEKIIQNSKNKEILPKEQQNKITKEEYIKIIELLKTPTFYELMQQLPVKKAIIIALRLGYIDGKYFSTETIATFLEIEQQEVREITTEILNLHKQNINNMIDDATAYLNETSHIRKLEQ